MKEATILFLLVLAIILTAGFLDFSTYIHSSNDLQRVNQAFQVKLKAHEKRIKSLEQIINETSNITVKATAYNAVPEQTDNEPNVNACRKYPRIGRIAVSQDLFYKGWTCGKWISIQGLGIFQIDDVMHVRKTDQVDVIMEKVKEAIDFGVKKNLNAVLLSHYGKM